MLNLDLIRRQPDLVRQALAKRGDEEAPLDQVLALDALRRALIQEADALRARRNEVSQEIGRLTRQPGLSQGDLAGHIATIRAEMRQAGERLDDLDEQVRALEEELDIILLTIPNLPAADVPLGQGEEDNRVVRTWGQPREFSFPPKPHWELGEALGILDLQRGAKVSGSRFFILRGAGARLERALVSWMMDLHTEGHGYTEIAPPYLVRRETMVGSGNLPKFADNLYHDEEDDLWLIPTAEVPITNLHREEILGPEALPRNYVACTPCFRREKAAAGRDTRGIKRVHQFNKVEMYKLVAPETSEAELERLVADAEDVCQRLGLPYRVLQLCTGDLGFPSAKTYDIEVWAAGCREWLEVSSCSNCTDFQARRARIRYRPSKESRPQYVHTLNGSGLALPRVVIAILENYQRADGSIVIPEALRPYTGFDTIPARPAGR